MNKTIITIMLVFVATMNRAQESTDIPEEWKNVTYESDEVLPDAEFRKGVARVNFLFLNYKPESGGSVEVTDLFKPFGVSIYYPCEWSAPISADGKATLEIPLSRENSSCQHRFVSHTVIALSWRRDFMPCGDEGTVLRDFCIQGEVCKDQPRDGEMVQ